MLGDPPGFDFSVHNVGQSFEFSLLNANELGPNSLGIDVEVTTLGESALVEVVDFGVRFQE